MADTTLHLRPEDGLISMDEALYSIDQVFDDLSTKNLVHKRLGQDGSKQVVASRYDYHSKVVMAKTPPTIPIFFHTVLQPLGNTLRDQFSTMHANDSVQVTRPDLQKFSFNQYVSEQINKVDQILNNREREGIPYPELPDDYMAKVLELSNKAGSASWSPFGLFDDQTALNNLGIYPSFKLGAEMMKGMFLSLFYMEQTFLRQHLNVLLRSEAMEGYTTCFPGDNRSHHPALTCKSDFFPSSVSLGNQQELITNTFRNSPFELLLNLIYEGIYLSTLTRPSYLDAYGTLMHHPVNLDTSVPNWVKSLDGEFLFYKLAGMPCCLSDPHNTVHREGTFFTYLLHLEYVYKHLKASVSGDQYHPVFELIKQIYNLVLLKTYHTNEFYATLLGIHKYGEKHNTQILLDTTAYEVLYVESFPRAYARFQKAAEPKTGEAHATTSLLADMMVSTLERNLYLLTSSSESGGLILNTIKHGIDVAFTVKRSYSTIGSSTRLSQMKDFFIEVYKCTTDEITEVLCSPLYKQLISSQGMTVYMRSHSIMAMPAWWMGEAIETCRAKRFNPMDKIMSEIPEGATFPETYGFMDMPHNCIAAVDMNLAQSINDDEYKAVIQDITSRKGDTISLIATRFGYTHGKLTSNVYRVTKKTIPNTQSDPARVFPPAGIVMVFKEIVPVYLPLFLYTNKFGIISLVTPVHNDTRNYLLSLYGHPQNDQLLRLGGHLWFLFQLDSPPAQKLMAETLFDSKCVRPSGSRTAPLRIDHLSTVYAPPGGSRLNPVQRRAVDSITSVHNSTLIHSCQSIYQLLWDEADTNPYPADAMDTRNMFLVMDLYISAIGLDPAFLDWKNKN